VCSGFKGQEPPRESLDRGSSPEGGRTRWTGEQGNEVTLVAACRDVLRVVSAAEGTDCDDDLAPVIEEAVDLSQPLGVVWTGGIPVHQGMEHDHRHIVNDDGYVSG
jgi:hypothetical protein